MAEIDPITLRFIAETNQFQAELRKATRTTDQELGRQEKRVQRLEAEYRQSSGAIANSLRGLAGVLATAFTGRELTGLLDSFTRLQNSLKVAGLEGEALAEVQTKLLDLSARYGVGIEGLADLYGKATDAGRSFGASEAQVLVLTEAVSQSLLITGTSAAQAQGALLGLSQALASGTVRAEEFNQINEGGLRPLLQAAAATERFGGDVNKLRAAVLDGTVSSREFFSAILAGSAELEGRASKAALTLSGAFEALRSQLVVYFGEAGQASGATAALASAIQALANNLDTIIPALAIIGAALGGRLVAGALAGGRALQVLAAYSAIATTSLAGTALAARGAGAALLAAFGGPVGLAITGVILAIGYLVTESGSAAQQIAQLRSETDNLRDSNDQLAARLNDAGVAIGDLGGAAASAAGKVNGLNNAMGQAIATAIQLSNQIAQLEVVQLGVERGVLARRRDGLADIGGDNATIQALDAKVKELDRGIALRIKAAKNGVAVPQVKAPTAAPPSVSPRRSRGPGNSGSSGPSGPSPEEIADRFNSQLASIAQQTLSAQSRLATTAEERAELELRSIELARLRTLEEIATDADYSAAQKARLEQQVEALAEAERETVELAKRTQLEREAQDLAEERYRAQDDALRIQFELAETEAERRNIARQIFDAEQAYLRSKLEAATLSSDLVEAERARLALASLDATANDRSAAFDRSNETALERYARRAKDVDERVEQAAVEKIDELNRVIADTFTRELGIKDPFISQLLQIFLDRAIFGPLAEALSSAGSGGGGIGGFLSSIGSAIFGGGRASGGYVAPGKLYRVNEGASPGRVEGFMPSGGGRIIPLGQMNMAQAGGAGAGGMVRIVIEEAPGFAARVRTEATGVAVEVTRQAAPQIIDAAANETLRRTSRPVL